MKHPLQPDPSLVLTPGEFEALQNAWQALGGLAEICTHAEDAVPVGLDSLLELIKRPVAEICFRLAIDAKPEEEGAE